MKETRVDYETVEKSVEVTICDECGKEVDHSYTLGLHPYQRNHRNSNAAVYQLDWCRSCVESKTDVGEFVPSGMNLRDVDFAKTPPEVTVEKKSIFPPTAQRVADPDGYLVGPILLFPLSLIIYLFAKDEEHEHYRAGFYTAILGMLLWAWLPAMVFLL